MPGPRPRGRRTCGPSSRSRPTTPTACGGTRTRSCASGRASQPGRTWNASFATVDAAMADTTNEAPDKSDDQDEVIVCAAVNRLVVTTGAPAELVESVVRDELGRGRGSARIQTFVPILTERAARRRLTRSSADMAADVAPDALHPASAGEPNQIEQGPTEAGPR